MTDLTKKFTEEADDIHNSDAEQIVKTIQSAVLKDELTDSITLAKAYSITGDLTQGILTNGSPAGDALTEKLLILESFAQGTVEDENTTDVVINNNSYHKNQK